MANTRYTLGLANVLVDGRRIIRLLQRPIAGGTVVSIKELATRIKEAVGYEGDLEFDASKPDGMPLKGLDSTRLAAMGWKPNTSLTEGLASTYHWYTNNLKVGVGS